MAILDLFRSKIRHSDPEVRAEAVRRLPSESTDLLARVMQEETDVAVRRIAFKKLKDPDILAVVARDDKDEGLRRQAAEKANGLWAALAIAGTDAAAAESTLAKLTDGSALATVAAQAQLASVREAALGRIQDPRALGEVARQAPDAAIRLAAVGRLDNANVLRAIALSDDQEDAALAAVDKLDDTETLDQIARKAKRKTVKRHAAEKLSSHADHRPTASKQRRAAQRELIAGIEPLLQTRDFTAGAAQLEAARERWKEVGSDADDGLTQRFNRASDAFYERHARFVGRSGDAAGDERTATGITAAETGHAALCTKVERLRGGGIAEALSAAEAEFAALGAPDETDGTALGARFGAACAAARARITEQRERGDARRPQLEALAVKAEALLPLKGAAKPLGSYAACRKEWRTLSSGADVDPDLLARFERVGTLLSERAAKQEKRDHDRRADNLAKLTALCTEAEALVTRPTNSLRLAVSALTRGQNWVKNPKPLPADAKSEPLLAGLAANLTQLHVRVQELRESDEWQRWANEPVREELCKEAEALLAEPDHRKASKALRDLEKKWREAGPVPQEKLTPLRDRFRKAQKEVRTKCDAFFKQQDGDRKGNLTLKIALCEQAEALKDSTQWKATAEELKRLQAEWKKIGPAPKASGDQVWKRFRAACDSFFERRKADLGKLDDERVSNLTRKVALAEQAEALKDSLDWEETASRLKQLQVDWKAIGPAPRAKADAVWNRFRGACDRFFERFSKRDSLEMEQNLETLNALTLRVEGIAVEAEQTTDENARLDLVDRLKDALNERRAIGPVEGNEADKSHERLDQAVARVVHKYPEAFQGTELDPEANYRRRNALTGRMEALAASIEEDRATAVSVADMAQQLQRALAANALRDRGSEDERRALTREYDEILSAWKRTRLLADDRGKEQDERFSAARTLYDKRFKALGK